MANVAVISKGIDSFPSLKEALTVNSEGVAEMEGKITTLVAALVEQERKITLAKEMGLPLRSFQYHRRNIRRKIDRAERTKRAYSSGYLQIPDFGWSEELELDKSKFYGFKLPGTVPIRVLEAIQAAKAKGLFEKVVVYRNGSDPIITGKIGNLCFFITSYK